MPRNGPALSGPKPPASPAPPPKRHPVQFNQTNHNAGGVTTCFAGPPPDGAMMVVAPLNLSPAERDRLQKSFADAVERGSVIVAADGVKVYQSIGGRFVEVGADPRPPSPAWLAPIILGGAVLAVAVAALVVRGF